MTDTTNIPDLTAVESSNISHIGWHDGKAWVRFKSGGIYHYAGVPKELHDQFMKADSKGRFFKDNILNKYQHQKIG